VDANGLRPIFPNVPTLAEPGLFLLDIATQTCPTGTALLALVGRFGRDQYIPVGFEVVKRFPRSRVIVRKVKIAYAGQRCLNVRRITDDVQRSANSPVRLLSLPLRFPSIRFQGKPPWTVTMELTCQPSSRCP